MSGRLQRVAYKSKIGFLGFVTSVISETPNDLGANLAELKWGNGRRVYFAVTLDDDGRVVILILGDNKNGQSKDIRQARKILAKYQE